VHCPTISAIVCFPDSDRQSCADETRLWQRYVGWFTDQPTESPPDGSQRCSSVDRRSKSLRSRHCHSWQFSLALCSWAHRFQTGSPCILSSARHCTSIPVWPSSPRRWLAVSSSSMVGDFQPTWCAPVASRNCRRPFICLCWAKALEQSPWWHYIGFIAVSFQKETENSLILAIIPGRYFVVCYGNLSPSWSLKLIVT